MQQQHPIAAVVHGRMDENVMLLELFQHTHARESEVRGGEFSEIRESRSNGLFPCVLSNTEIFVVEKNILKFFKRGVQLHFPTILSLITAASLHGRLPPTPPIIK